MRCENDKRCNDYNLPCNRFGTDQHVATTHCTTKLSTAALPPVRPHFGSVVKTLCECNAAGVRHCPVLVSALILHAACLMLHLTLLSFMIHVSSGRSESALEQPSLLFVYSCLCAPQIRQRKGCLDLRDDHTCTRRIAGSVTPHTFGEWSSISATDLFRFAQLRGVISINKTRVRIIITQTRTNKRIGSTPHDELIVFALRC
jgi:hypothetical protein